MLAHLRQPGASLSVIPEGIAGIFLTQSADKETIFLSKRKGFVKLAIQAGAGKHYTILRYPILRPTIIRDPLRHEKHDLMSVAADIVPVYHLGQSQLLSFWGVENISRTWRASVGVFWGAYGLPLPRRHPMITLVGAPIKGMPAPP
jgi:2-acylglycerol O-acyltransferase 2